MNGIQAGINRPPEKFDYLDFRENEAKLEQLRTQNMNSYAHFLEPSQQKPKE